MVTTVHLGKAALADFSSNNEITNGGIGFASPAS